MEVNFNNYRLAERSILYDSFTAMELKQHEKLLEQMAKPQTFTGGHNIRVFSFLRQF